MLPPIDTDSRFLEAMELFRAGSFFESSELFEELYFEAVRDEVEFARFFLQLSVGMVHAERGQSRPAIERLDEAVKAAARVTNWRGVDGALLVARASAVIERFRVKF